MTFRRLSYLVAVAPLVVGGVGLFLSRIDPRSPVWEARGPASVPAIFLVFHVYGVWLYLPFAVFVALFVRRLDPPAHRRLTCLSPLLFACWVLLCLSAHALLGYPGPLTWRDGADLLRISAYAIPIGYVYVALLLISWRLLPQRIRSAEPAV